MRRSGQTFRMLATSFAQASGSPGSRVLIAFGTREALLQAMHMARAMTQPLGAFATFRWASQRIELGNGSRIDFVVPDGRSPSSFCGTFYDAIETDNSAVTLPGWWLETCRPLTRK